MFDWKRFCDAHSVAYVTRGPNVGRNHIAIKCPWCGSADPSEHLNISLSGAGYRCLRNPHNHAGRSRAWLIQSLLHCSPEEARRLAGDSRVPIPLEQEIGAQVAKLLGVEKEAPAAQRTLRFPSQIKSMLTGAPRSSRLFWEYLRNERDYDYDEARWVVKAYGLRYALWGRYRYRIVIPILDERGKLLTWTARSIVKGEPLRYDTLSLAAGALERPTNALLGLPLLHSCSNPEVLVVCEGPFDAMRITSLGRSRGVYGTCLFGLNVSDAQVLLLDKLMGRFQRMILLVDPDARYLVLRLREHLTPLIPESGYLPAGIKDPGELPFTLGQELLSSWL